MQAKVFMRRAYDLDALIYDEGYRDQYPYAMIGAHPYETNYQNGLEWIYMEQYVVHQIFDTFHISFTEFLAQPIDRVSKMISYAQRRQEILLEDKKKQEEGVNKAMPGVPSK